MKKLFFSGLALIAITLASTAADARALKCVVANAKRTVVLKYFPGEEYLQEGTLGSYKVEVMHNTPSGTYDVQVSTRNNFSLNSTVPVLPDAQLAFNRLGETIRVQCR